MAFKKKTKYYGIYRGIVLDNRDDGLLSDGTPIQQPGGRCKIFFEGVYPEKFRENNGASLPWAEPIFPIFGGSGMTEVQSQKNEELQESVYQNFKNPIVGVMSTPHIGAMVWGFFEEGNIQYPKFFGTTHTGFSWSPEHRNQHIISTDNVRIVIDEEVENEKSTQKTDSANELTTSSAEAFADATKKKQMPVRVNITIDAIPPENSLIDKEGKNTTYCAVNLTINGNVNSRIYGNVYERHEGDLFKTHIGNTYERIEGDIEVEHIGYTRIYHEGKREFTVDKGDNFETYGQNQTVHVVQNLSDTIDQNQTLLIKGTSTNTVKKNKTTTIEGNKTETTKQNSNVNVDINHTETVKGSATYKATGATNIKSDATVIVKGPMINLN